MFSLTKPQLQLILDLMITKRNKKGQSLNDSAFFPQQIQ